MDIDKAKRAFWQQRTNAKRRGIEWRLTLQQWLEFWGEDLDRRGRGRHELGMQRPCDSGPYAPDNIRKGTPADNARTRRGWMPNADDEPNLGYASVWDMYGV